MRDIEAEQRCCSTVANVKRLLLRASRITCVPISCARPNGSRDAMRFVGCGMPTTGLMSRYGHSNIEGRGFSKAAVVL
jgi:hypothetical protein